MEKVDLNSWGGTKVRNNLKPLWEQPIQDDAEFGQYQQSLAKTITNTNELIDKIEHIEGVLANRPF